MTPEVQDWFSARTSSLAEWDAAALVERKGSISVSVVLPARNEAATVGTIVRRLRRALVHDVPLVDEVVVVDSGSQDRTGDCARDAGARVVRQQDVVPDLGDRPGKGEALWKSLFVTSGEVVVFVDADLQEFDPCFVVGLLGPLLSDPDVDFVKAIYDRPLVDGSTVVPAGGGRVTELLARPLLNVHYPELAGVVQPLAGEYAARRTLLERLTFVSDYGVEIAMLVDVLREVGLGGIAQVDLGTRRHRNSSDAALGRMAGQVYLALLSRIERDGLWFPTAPPQTLLTQYVREGHRYSPEVFDVAVQERPPVITLPQYRLRSGTAASA